MAGGKQTAAGTTYTNLLSLKGYGRAMWDPEPRTVPSPSNQDGPPVLCEVEIGDVGAVDERGGFMPLFNVILPKDDPRNVDGLPEYFEKLDYNRRLLISNDAWLRPGAIAQHIEYKGSTGGELGGGL